MQEGGRRHPNNDVLESLRNEHRTIRDVAGALERWSDLIEGGERRPQGDVTRFVRFLREFVELVYHEKEESLLLPALASSGMSWETGPLGDIRSEHRLERHLIQVFEAAVPQAPEWSVHHRRRLGEVARSLSSVLRSHLAEEERSLLPIIHQRLGASSLDGLCSGLRRFDQAREASGEAAAMRQLACDLLAEYPTCAEP